jgi:hypothetical protein
MPSREHHVGRDDRAAAREIGVPERVVVDDKGHEPELPLRCACAPDDRRAAAVDVMD